MARQANNQHNFMRKHMEDAFMQHCHGYNHVIAQIQKKNYTTRESNQLLLAHIATNAEATHVLFQMNSTVKFKSDYYYYYFSFVSV